MTTPPASKPFAIYLLENDQFWYIGSAWNKSTPTSRFNAHKSGRGGAPRLYEVLRAGIELYLKVLETGDGSSHQAAYDLEASWISKYVADDPRETLNRNLRPNVRHGWDMDDEMRAKMSARLMGKPRPDVSAALMGSEPWNKGLRGIYSEETRQRLREARAGQVFADDYSDKLSAASKAAYANGKRLIYQCGDCELVTFAAPLGRHQIATGHVGRDLAPDAVLWPPKYVPSNPSGPRERMACPECGLDCGVGAGFYAHMKAVHPTIPLPPTVHEQRRKRSQ